MQESAMEPYETQHEPGDEIHQDQSINNEINQWVCSRVDVGGVSSRPNTTIVRLNLSAG